MGEINLRPVDYAPVSKISKQATLLGLPYKLRNQIYNYLLPCGENLTIRAVERPSVQSPIIDLSSSSRSNTTTGQVYELDTRECGISCEPCAGRQFKATIQFDRPTNFTDTFASLCPRKHLYRCIICCDPQRAMSDLMNGQSLRTCRQINEETTPLLYGKNRIHLTCVNGRLGIVVYFLSLMRFTTRQSIRRLGIRGIHPKALEACVQNNHLTEEQLLWDEYHLEMASTFFKIVGGMNLVELLIRFDLIDKSSEVYALNSLPWLQPFLSRFEPSKLLIEEFSDALRMTKAERAFGSLVGRIESQRLQSVHEFLLFN